MSSSGLHTLVITLTFTHKTYVQMHTYTTQARKEGRKGGKNIGHPTERRPCGAKEGIQVPMGKSGSSLLTRSWRPTMKTRLSSVPQLKLCKTFNQEARKIQRLWQARESWRTAQSPVAASVRRILHRYPTIRQERKWLIDDTSSSLTSPQGLDTSQPQYGRIGRRKAWVSRPYVTAPPLQWPDTLQQSMSSTRASSKKMSHLQGSNWPDVTRSWDTRTKCPQNNKEPAKGLPLWAYCAHTGSWPWAHPG